MIIVSKYESLCRQCRAVVKVGDRCEWDKAKKGVLCLTCHGFIQPVAATVQVAQPDGRGAHRPRRTPDSAAVQAQQDAHDKAQAQADADLMNRYMKQAQAARYGRQNYTVPPVADWMRDDVKPTPAPKPKPALAPALAALEALEEQFVRMASKTATPAIDKAWTQYEKIKRLADNPGTKPEQRVALGRAIIVLINAILQEESSYVI